MLFINYPQPIPTPSLFILGFFDGIHQGHLSLFQKARLIRQLHPEYKIFVGTFRSSPSVFLAGMSESTLFLPEERFLALGDMGVDGIYLLPTTREFLSLTAREFLSHLILSSPKTYLIMGEEARFGSDQKGGHDFLKDFFLSHPSHSFETIPTIKDGSQEKISSSTLRKYLKKGEMDKVNPILDQPYFLYEEILHGEKKGRLIGFPTINMTYSPQKISPPFGVYRSFTQIDHLSYHSLTYLSNFRLDVVSQIPLAETWISSFNESVYGKKARVYLLSFHRPPKKVASLEELKILLEHDKSSLSEKFF